MNTNNYAWNTTRTLAIICCLLLQSCLKVDTIQTDNWQPEVAIPLINSNIKLADFLNNSNAADFFQVDSNNFLTLVYEDKIPSPIAGDILELEDFGIIVPDTVVGIPPTFFDFEQTINKVTLKQGTLRYSISSTIPELLDLAVQFINIKQDGNIFAHYATIPYNGTSPSMISGTLDLAGYTLDFSTHFVIQYIARDSDGNRYRLDEVNYSFEDLDFSYIDGDFGGASFVMPQSNFLIDVLEEAKSGEFFLEDPKVNIDIRNSIGFPVEISSIELQGVDAEGNAIPFTSPLDDGVLIDFPSMQELGGSRFTRIALDKTNSNILDVINAFPDQVGYTFRGAIQSTLPDSLSFAVDTSKMDITLNVELPLWGKFRSLVYESETDFDPEDLLDANQIEFRLNADNGFPLETDFQVYFLNAADVVVDSLAEMANPILIPAATVDATGRVDMTATADIMIPLGKEDINRLDEVRKLKVRAQLATVNGGNTSVRFFDDYELKLKLGLKASIE